MLSGKPRSKRLALISAVFAVSASSSGCQSMGCWAPKRYPAAQPSTSTAAKISTSHRSGTFTGAGCMMYPASLRALVVLQILRRMKMKATSRSSGRIIPGYCIRARKYTTPYHTISARTPPARGGRPAFCCTTRSPSHRQNRPNSCTATET